MGGPLVMFTSIFVDVAMQWIQMVIASAHNGSQMNNYCASVWCKLSELLK